MRLLAIDGDDRLAPLLASLGRSRPDGETLTARSAAEAIEPLGLSICRNIIGSLGGEILVESEPGVGSTFRVRLPISAVPEAVVGAAPPTQAPPRRGRILIVDDEEPVVRGLKRMLAEEHDVATETDSRRVMERIFAAEPYDVVLCDLMMPDVTGMDLYEELGRRAPELLPRLVFLTGGAFTRKAQDFLENIPNPKLDKPVSQEKLRATIRELLH